MFRLREKLKEMVLSSQKINWVSSVHSNSSYSKVRKYVDSCSANAERPVKNTSTADAKHPIKNTFTTAGEVWNLAYCQCQIIVVLL